jgi:hypothetical protein
MSPWPNTLVLGQVRCSSLFLAGEVEPQVPARYSYLYEFRNGDWLITHHHSSVQPATPR